MDASQKEYQEYLEYQDFLGKQGAGAASGFDIEKYRANEEKYGGVTGALKTGALGAAKAASFGTSTQFLTKSGLVSPETIKGLEETNPISDVVGQLTGVVAPAILSGGTTAVAEGGLGAAAKLAPTNLLMRGAGRIAEGAAAALPEATTLAGKVIQGAGTAALGSAVEGAAYGAGQVIHEEALGDPTLNAEKVLSEIGYGAAIGGLFGAALGGTSAAVREKFPQFISSQADNAGLEHAVNSEVTSPKEREGIISGLTKLKGNAKEIKAAAAELDAPVLESQISSSDAVHKLDSLLVNNPSSPIGIARQQMLQEGLDKAEQAVMSTVGSATPRSQVELGNALKESLTSKISAENEPIKALYDTIKQSTEHIPVSDKAKQVIEANIKQLENYKFSGSLERKTGDALIDNLANIQTVDDIKRYATMLNQSIPATASPGERFAVGRVVEKLKNLEEASIVRGAEKMAQETNDPAVKSMIEGLIGQREEANAAYKTLRGKMEDLGSVLGKKRVGGVADFLEHIEDLTPEKLAKKLFAKNDSEFLGRFAKDFPEEMQLVREAEKGKMLEMKGMMADGKLNVKKFIGEVDKLSPEAKNALFSADEMKKLGAVKTYVESIPKDMNPSGTSHAIAARDFLQKVFGSWKEAGAGAALGTAVAGPVGGILGGIGGAVAGAGSGEMLRDFAIKKLLKAAVDSTEKGGLESMIRRLSTVERLVNNSTNSIDSMASRTLRTGVEMVHGVKNTFIPMSYPDKLKSFEKIKADLDEKTKDPESYLDTVSRATEGLFDVAPQTSGSIQATMTAATEFLKSKMPNTDPPAPLSPPSVPSSAELSKFFRYYSVVENPYLVMKQIKSGTLTSESMETMEKIYPGLLTEMRTALMDKLTAKKKSGMLLPYQTKVMLSAFLGTDLVAGLSQQNIMGNQVSFHMPSQKQDNIEMQAQMGKPSQKGMESVTLAERSMTGTQAVSTRKLRS